MDKIIINKVLDGVAVTVAARYTYRQVRIIQWIQSVSNVAYQDDSIRKVSALYSGSDRLESRPEHEISCLMLFVSFLSKS
jgi:hypothetical protein